MKEKDFTRKFLKDYKAKHPKAFIYKIPDAFRTGIKPFDAFIVNEGKFTALEFKVQEGKKTFRTSKVTPHQKEFLKQVKEAGGKAFVILNAAGEVFCFDIDEVLENEVIELKGD